MEQLATWIKMTNELPVTNGWYLVRYINEKEIAMYFKTNKRHYSDSQWFVESNTGHSWQGKLPDEWLRLEAQHGK